MEAVLINTGKTDLQFEKGAALSYIVTCRLSTSPPGRWDIAAVSPLEGSVWGGVTDSKPDPADPEPTPRRLCRTPLPVNLSSKEEAEDFLTSSLAPIRQDRCLKRHFFMPTHSGFSGFSHWIPTSMPK